MDTIYSTPVLETLSSKGTKKYWQGHVLKDGDNYYTQASYWQDTKAGQSKVQFSDPGQVTSKNVGRANETSLHDQAMFEMTSMVKVQRDKSYREAGEANTALPLPMLAQKFVDKAHTVTYPVTLQHKYDGCRALCDGEKMWSRKGIEFQPDVIRHIIGLREVVKPKTTLINMFEDDEEHIALDTPINTEGYILDGEIILPKEYSLQDTVSALKKFNSVMSPKLLYRVYDLVAEKLTFPERYEILKRIVNNSKNPSLILAPVFTAVNEDEIMEYQAIFTQEKWEGTMIRTHDRGYATGQRDRQLLKLKEFIEEEFRVVDVIDGPKKHGKAVLVFETEEGKHFKATPEGSEQHRRELLQNRLNIIGQIWTVRYQVRTPQSKSDPEKGNVPKFNTAICERIPALQGDPTLG